MKNVMLTVVSTINFIKSRALNNCQFRELLIDIEADHADLLYYCEVRWNSSGQMLKRFFLLIAPLQEFMDTKTRHVAERSDPKCLADPTFMVDITGHL